MHLITYKVQGMAYLFEISIRQSEINWNHKKIDTDCIRSRNKRSIVDLIGIENDIDIFELSILAESMENHLCKIFG